MSNIEKHIGNIPESELEREKSEFLERVERLVEESGGAVLFSGKIVRDIEIGGRRLEYDDGYQSLNIAGEFREIQEPWISKTTDETSSSWKFSHSIQSFLNEPSREDVSKVDEIVLVTEPKISKTEGTKTENKKEEKRILGVRMKIKTSTQVPNVVKKPLLLSDFLEGGGQEKALFVSLFCIGGGDARPYINRYILALPEGVVSEIFGTKEKPGGLLKKHPNLVRDLFNRAVPELMEDFDKGFAAESLQKKRRVFVGAPDFSEESPDIAEAKQKLQSGVASERVVEYQP